MTVQTQPGTGAGPAAASVVPPCPFCGGSGAALIYRRRFQDREWQLAHCRGCGLRYTTPLPTLDDLPQFYAGSYHRELLQPGVPERVFGRKFSRYRDWLTTFVRSGRSLDIGTTTGLLPFLLRQAGFAAEGVELNPETADWGRRHYGIPMRNQPIEAGGYEAAAYDLVTMTDVLEHTVHPLTSLRAVAKLVKPGGYVLITFPDITSLESRYYRLLARWLRRDWLWGTCHIPLHTWEFTPPTARALFAAAGLQVAGFRRSQPPWRASRESLALWALSLPPAALSLPGVGRRLGTQMEFMLRMPA